MYIAVNVAKPNGKSPGASAAKDPNVTIIATKDIATWPSRDDKSVLIAGNFVPKVGAKMISVYMTPSKIKAGFESEGDEDAISFKQKFEGEHPGNELEIAEFVQNWTGEPCIIIYGSCADSFRKVIGTKCAPVQLKPSLKDDNDSRVNMLVFEQFAKSGFVPGHYTGALTFGAPYDVPTVTTTAVNSTNGNIYRMPVLGVTAAITFTELSLNHGDIITLVGQGGAAPATLTQGVTDKKAVLKNGTTWVALEGATIHLQVYTAGALTFLVELSRS